MDTASVGQTLRWARQRAGMTQHQLASVAQIPQPTIARIESGSVTPRTATLIALLDATGHQLVAEPIGSAVENEVALRMAIVLEARAPAQSGTSRKPRRS